MRDTKYDNASGYFHFGNTHQEKKEIIMKWNKAYDFRDIPSSDFFFTIIRFGTDKNYRPCYLWRFTDSKAEFLKATNQRW